MKYYCNPNKTKILALDTAGSIEEFVLFEGGEITSEILTPGKVPIPETNKPKPKYIPSKPIETPFEHLAREERSLL